MFFFFKQKTAYEMRISDWSSDVCSSDLLTDTGRMVLRFNGEQVGDLPIDPLAAASPEYDRPWVKTPPQKPLGRVNHPLPFIEEIGRASCRERVCQYV